MLDHERFESWYRTANPGEQYTYYIGLLGMESKSKFHHHIKHTAWKYALQGRVYLFQRKIEENEFDYIAVKAKQYVYKLVPFDYSKSKLEPREKEEADG